MKLNGKNIILDSDVTVAESSNSLSEVLKSYSNDLEKLKSNVKWLYKYGGVGSGGSGGSATTQKWYSIIDINGTSYQAAASDTGEIATGNLIVNGSGLYPISLQIIRPQGSSFSATVSWFNGSATTTKRYTLNADNSWTINDTILIGGNNTISVKITDGEYTAILNVSYISTPYIFQLDLCDSTGSSTKQSGSDIFISDVISEGLRAKLSYDIGIDVEEDNEGNKVGVTYTITDILGNVKEKATLDLSQGNKGSILLNLLDDSSFLTSDDNAATYTYYLSLTVVTKGGGTSSTQDFQLSFNLIPSNLYLKVIPDYGTIYKSEQSDPQYIYYTGPKSFSITPFFGNNQGRIVYVSILVDGNVQIDNKSVTERNTLNGITLDINNSEESDWQEHELTFTARCGNVSNSFTYYLYSRNINSNLKWYPLDSNNQLVTPTQANYWRNSIDYTFDLSASSTYQMTNQSNIKEIVLDNVNSSNPRDILFAVGIQYSEINNHLYSPIISINCSSNPSDESYINIFYNKITLASSAEGSKTEVLCYLNKTPYEEYSENSNNYHLLQIYKRCVKEEDANTRYYEITIYIDGVLEACFSKWSNIEIAYDRILLHPGNYFINHLELSYFNRSKLHEYMDDSNIVRYWYTYKSNRLGYSDLNTSLLAYFENNVGLLGNVKYSNIPITYADTVKSIANESDVPVIFLKYSETKADDSFLDWFVNGNYQENDIIPSKQVSVLYSKGKQDLQEIKTEGCNFIIDIQGSTTRKYRGKNLELGLVAVDDNDTNTYLYSPNFLKSDTNTYLPENSFTLKADAVDSSHSNNTCIGDFVNKNTAKFADAIQDTTYGPYIKNCLIGFPVLVFIEVTSYSGDSNIYYLGVYNFNLGRKSFFNLGYINTAVLDEAVNVSNYTTGLSEGFQVYRLPEEKTNKISTFLAAEITGNDNRFDFSQYDTSILVRDPNNPNDQYAMFDDIETGIQSKDDQAKALQELVRGVAKSGHYIFKTLGKNFGDYSEGYNAITADGTSRNQVPDYTKQYKRIVDTSGNNQFVLKDEEIQDGTSNDLDLLINPFNASNVVNRLDYNSLVEYFTICMAFGLVDSVQKNLNVKTWNSNRFYSAFYDMDSSLGQLNDASLADYFAFTDYWYSKYNELENGALRPSEVTIYRDFSPAGNHGFDIPSSYLFAVAKYSKIFEKELSKEEGQEINITFPSRLWAQWRRKNGILQDAETFIKNYYQHHLDNVNELMINFNYRSKYFVVSGNGYDNFNFPKFKGRRLEYVRQWLDGRFHLLDAYFNLPQSISPINRLDLTTNEWVKTDYNEPILLDGEVDINNEDIYVLHSIFGNQARFLNTIDLLVKSQEYSPLFITPSGSTSQKMLLVDRDTWYNVYSERTGFNNIVLGGSSLWTDLDNINSFNGDFQISSKLLTSLKGNEGTISSWNVTLPSAKEISLTSANYSGILTLENSYPDLGTVDISNSSISLTLNNLQSLKTLKAVGCKGATLSVQNCPNIENLSISGQFGVIQIQNVPISMSLNGTRSSSINLSTSKENIDISINADSTVANIELSGFRNISITGCNNLNSVIISGNNTQSVTISGNGAVTKLERVSINATDKLTTLNLSNNIALKSIELTGTPNLKTINFSNTSITSISYNGNEVTEYLDLSPNTKLTSFNIRNNSEIRFIQLPNINGSPIPLSTSFTGCQQLERVYGNVTINCKACFRDLSKFSVLGSSITNKVPVYAEGDPYNQNPATLFYEGTQVTNMALANSDCSYTFRGTNCTVNDIYYILYTIKDSVTDISSLFAYVVNPNILFDFEPDKYMFNKCSQVTNIDEIFRTGLRNENNIKISSYKESHQGLFTPLVNLTKFKGVFLGYNKYMIDKNIFKGATFSKLKSIVYFNPNFIVDDVDDYDSYPESIQDVNIIEKIDTWGDLSGIFDSLTALTDIGISFSTYYLNYEHQITIPNSVTSVRKSFISQYGKGNLQFKEIFKTGSKLQKLLGSFRVVNKLNDIGVNLEIGNDFFSNVPDLEQIGFEEGAGDYATTRTTATFVGDGIVKSLVNNLFPHNIVSKLTKLTKFNCLFDGIRINDNVKLPGDMFINNTLLTDIQGAFQNLYAPIELTSNGFINCTKLQNVSYLFFKDNVSEGLLSCSISQIPKKFFYHGGSEATKSITGSNDPEHKTEETIEVTYNLPNRSIQYASYCFSGNTIGFYTGKTEKDEIENNPDYNPFIWVLNGTTWERHTPDNAHYQFYWTYNGSQDISEITSDVSDCHIPEEMIVEDSYSIYNTYLGSSDPQPEIFGNGTITTNFICSPDLLRYCTSTCTIIGLFRDCGKTGQWKYPNGGDMYTELRNRGITGRICPYLLKPLTGITSIKEMFTNCKAISSYKLQEGEYYTIPKTFFSYSKNITDLTRAFSGCIFGKEVTLRGIFNYLTGQLIAEEVFYQSYFPRNVANVFSQNNVQTTTAAFAVSKTENPGSVTQPRPYTQNVQFEAVFKNYTNKQYNTNYYYTFNGYRRDCVTHESTKSLPYSEGTDYNFNYTTYEP